MKYVIIKKSDKLRKCASDVIIILEFRPQYKEYLYQKPFLPDNCNTYNMNDNPKNNILISENIRQKKTNNSVIFRILVFSV